MKKTRVLVIGPSRSASRGGMASVIQQEYDSPGLQEHLKMKFHASFKDGNLFSRIFYCMPAIIIGFFRIPFADTLHIHMTSKGSMVRKLIYVQLGVWFHKKIVLQIHCCDYFFQGLSSMPKWYQSYVSRLMKRADKVLCLSEKFQEQLSDSLCLDNCIFFPNGIDLSEYHYQENNFHAYIIYLGKICEDKGLRDLIEALYLLKTKEHLEIPCLLFGCGEISRYQKLCNQYRLTRVRFMGWVSGEEKKKYLSNSNILVLPSYHEGFPVVILEAMASGSAVIATDVGAIPEMIDTSLKPHDVPALADIIKDKWNSITAREKSDGEAAHTAELRKDYQKVKEKYNIETLHKELGDILK